MLLDSRCGENYKFALRENWDSHWDDIKKNVEKKLKSGENIFDKMLLLYVDKSNYNMWQSGNRIY